MSARDMNEVAEFIKTMKFKKKTFGGVDEADVWRKIDLLQQEYETAYIAQEERYKALIIERNKVIQQLKGQQDD